MYEPGTAKGSFFQYVNIFIVVFLRTYCSLLNTFPSHRRPCEVVH
jgi:hypothetical protein